MTTKEQMLRAITALPDDATVEDAMERLYRRPYHTGAHGTEGSQVMEQIDQTIAYAVAMPAKKARWAQKEGCQGR